MTSAVCGSFLSHTVEPMRTERPRSACRVSLIKIIQRATAKGLDQIYIGQYGPQTGAWFRIDDDIDGIPVKLAPDFPA